MGMYFYIPISVSINLSTRWQTSKKEGIFLELQFVGVRLHGRVEVLKKQTTARNFRCFPCCLFVMCTAFDFGLNFLFFYYRLR